MELSLDILTQSGEGGTKKAVSEVLRKPENIFCFPSLICYLLKFNILILQLKMALFFLRSELHFTFIGPFYWLFLTLHLHSFPTQGLEPDSKFPGHSYTTHETYGDSENSLVLRNKSLYYDPQRALDGCIMMWAKKGLSSVLPIYTH